MTGAWPKLLGGLLVWAAHFMTIYGIGEWAGDGRNARLAIAIVTVLAIALVATLFGLARADRRDSHFDRWRRSTTLIGLCLSAIAILWQALPAAIGLPVS